MSTVQEPEDKGVDVSQEVIDASNEHADELFASLAGDFGEMEEEGLDPIAVVYALWISFTYVLVEAGWKPEELAKDLAHHAHNHDVEGHG